MNILLAACLFLFAGRVSLAEETTEPVCQFPPQLVSAVEKTRQLSFRAPLICLLRSQSEYQAYIQDRQNDSQPGQRFDMQLRVLQLLGAVPRDYDWRKCLLESALDFAAPIFDHRLQSILIPAWRPLDKATLAFQLTRALQSEHFPNTQNPSQTTDSEMALYALLEGDAARVQEQVELLAFQAKPQSEPSCNPAPVLMAQAIFPVAFGRYFVQRLLDEGGTDRVNQAFAHPPQTTSEVIHRGKYPAPQRTSWLCQRNLPGEKTPLFTDRLGQYMIRLIVGQTHSADTAILAAKGWVDDCAKLFELELGGGLNLSWESVWESTSDADQFGQALLGTLAAQRGLSVDISVPRLSVKAAGFPEFSYRREEHTVRLSVSEKYGF